MRTLVVLTLLGGLARFLWLGRPTLWGDEALVFARTYADWDDLWAWLRNDDFTPLHYVAVWGLGRFVRLTPEMLRLIPAAFGILMIPGIYWLGCELRGRRIGLMAAAVAASSAFLIAYSRDAKMYMPAWTLGTLHVAAVLWWTRRGGLWRWVAWVVLGLLMVGWHASMAAVLAVSLLIAVTAPVRPTRRARAVRVTTALLGVGLIAGLLVAYYRLVPNGPPTPVPEWVADYNAGRGLAGRVGYVLSAWLMGWEWPRAADRPRVEPVTLWVLTTMTLSVAGLLLIALLHRTRRTPRADETAEGRTMRPWVWITVWSLLPAAVAGVAWLAFGKDITLPRYLGFAVPAVFVAVAMLLRRLDFSIRPGASAVALLIVIACNGAVSLVRFPGPTEPPADRYMADVVAAAGDEATAMVLHAIPQPVGEGPVGPGAPGTAYPGGFVSAYYGLMEQGLDRGEDRLPAQMLRSPIAVNVQLLGHARVWDDTSPADLAEIAAERARPARVRRLFVWSGHDAADELVLEELRKNDAGWRRLTDDRFAVREPWTFQSYQPMRRRVYER